MRSITCTNNDGYSLTFGETGFTPFFLAHVDGIYEKKNKVSVSQNTMTDGGTYNGSVAAYRNVVLTVKLEPTDRYFQKKRDALNQLFADSGTLTYTENGVSRIIDYKVESIEPTLKKGNINISLICPDPFFYDVDVQTVTMATWVPAFEFEHEFLAAGEEIGYKENVRMQNIVNDFSADDVGLLITIEVSGEVENPSIVHVEQDIHSTVGDSSKPLTLVFGDKLIISSYPNDMRVYLIHGGVKTEINEYLTEDSDYIRLGRGNNHIGYGADDGEEYMSVTIQYRLKYVSA